MLLSHCLQHIKNDNIAWAKSFYLIQNRLLRGLFTANRRLGYHFVLYVRTDSDTLIFNVIYVHYKFLLSLLLSSVDFTLEK